MKTEMKLYPRAFEDIKLGKKKVEFRLFDEKRKKLREDDDLVFVNVNNDEKIKTKIVDIILYHNFDEMFDKEHSLIKRYYKEGKRDFVKSFDKIYSKQDRQMYFPVAIHFKKVG